MANVLQNQYVLFTEKGRLSTRRSRGRVANIVTFSSTTSYILLTDIVGFFPLDPDLVTSIVGNSAEQDAVSTLWQVRLANGTSFIVGNSFIRTFQEAGGDYLAEIELYRISTDSETGLAPVHNSPVYLISSSIKSIDSVEIFANDQQPVRIRYVRIRLINGANYIVALDSLGSINAVNEGRGGIRG